MRKISASLFMSLDGVVDAPQEWNFPYMNDEMVEAIEANLARLDTLLLGRRTYEEWAGHWPKQPSDGGGMADRLNAATKLVASTTLTTVSWQNSTLIEGDVIAAVEDLKQGAGEEIQIVGSGTLVRNLLTAELIDELQLMVHPIVVGNGKRLFAGGVAQKPLELVESEIFETGVANLKYRPASRPANSGKGPR